MKSDNPIFPVSPGCHSTATASPGTLALDRNFRISVTSLKKELVRTIHYLQVIYVRKVYKALGYSNIRDYAAAAGGLTEDQCKAFLKIGSRLAEYPEMEAALAQGDLSWRKAELIAAKADRHEVSELIDTARKISTEALRARLVPAVGRSRTSAPTATKPRPIPRAAPSDASRPQAKPADTPCYVTFRFTPEQYAVWSGAMAATGGVGQEQVLIDALMQSGPTAAGPWSAEPPYLLLLQVCPACDGTTLTTNRGTFAVTRPLLETARCDAVVEDQDARRRQTIPPRLRRLVLRRDGYQCQAAGCANTRHLQLHHRRAVSHGGRTRPENLVVLCGGCHRALHEGEAALKAASRDPVR